MASLAETIDQNVQDDLSCLMIPLKQTKLLLPGVAVAEIAPIAAPSLISDAPPWLLGFYQWRNQQVALVDFECLRSEAEEPVLTEPKRIVVLNRTGWSGSISFFAVVAAGIPRLTQVTEDNCLEDSGVELTGWEMAALSCGGEKAVIPDLVGLEKAVAMFTQ